MSEHEGEMLQGAPELPGKHSGRYDDAEEAQAPKLQLIQSTKPDEPAEEENDAVEAADEDDQLNEHVLEPGDPDGVVAADEEQKLQEENPPVPEAGKPKRKRRWLKVLVALVLLAAATYGVYWYGSKKGDKAAHPTQTSQAQKQPSTPTATTQTKHYDSSIYTLGFDYPGTWVVSDTAAKLTVVSPATQLTQVDGTKVSAHVAVTMQNKQSTIAGFPANGAIAQMASDKLTYKQPTSIQRAQTYLSYLSYHKENGLDALYVTGDNGYQQGQTVPMSDVVKGNPLVSVAFETCNDSDCSTGTPTPITLLATSWKSAQANKDITSLLESLQLN